MKPLRYSLTRFGHGAAVCANERMRLTSIHRRALAQQIFHHVSFFFFSANYYFFFYKHSSLYQKYYYYNTILTILRHTTIYYYTLPSPIRKGHAITIEVVGSNMQFKLVKKKNKKTPTLNIRYNYIVFFFVKIVFYDNLSENE